jgi:hypothetical protein
MTAAKKPVLGVVGGGSVDFQIADDLPPLVRPGFHEVMLDGFQTALMFQGKAPKLIMNFAIVSHGEDFGKRVPRYYNVAKIIGKPQSEGRFKVSRKGDFLREYLTLFHYSGSRLDRLPMSRFSGVTIKAEIKTVKHSRGKDIPELLQYSKVARLIKVIG